MTVYCVAATRRRLVGIADVTAASQDSAHEMFRLLRLAVARQAPGEHLEADLHSDGAFVHWWVVRPFGPLPAPMVAALRRCREQVAS